MESYRGRQFGEEQIREKALVATAQGDIKWLNKEHAVTSAKKIFNQVIEIGVNEQGRCHTDYFPTNQEALDLLPPRRSAGIRLGPAPLNPEGEENATAEQKMLWTRWLEAIAREEASGTGQIGPLHISLK